MTIERRYDVVVVGGGVAGVMTAYRLSRRGRRVLLVEAHRIGAGATGRNQGIVHSGCLMARLHAPVGCACRDEQRLFEQAFPGALRQTRESWYLARQDRFDEFLAAWRTHGFAYQLVDRQATARWIRSDVLRSSGIARVAEPIINTSAMLSRLVAACRHAGAHIVTGVRVDAVERTGDEVCGVRLATGERLAADVVVVAAGLGTHRLLESVSSQLLPLLQSRKVVLGSYRHQGLPASVICLDFGGPTAIPVTSDLLLLGLYGGTQPPTDRADGAIDRHLVRELRTALSGYFTPGVVDLDSEAAWLSTKTEVVDDRADGWGTQPGFFVGDHAAIDGVTGLVTAIPGKMSLAFHTSQAVAHRLGLPDEPLALPMPEHLSPHPEEINDQPWLAQQQRERIHSG